MYIFTFKRYMKPDLSNIDNIIFDLGNVLLNLDFEASIKAFHKLGLNEALLNKQQAYADPVFYKLEIGTIKPEVFRERIRQLLDNPEASDRQVDDAWYAMIRDIPPKRVEVLRRLRDSYKIYLFSNTNAIHIGRLLPDFKRKHGFDFPALFDRTFYSHEIQARKPDSEAYQKVIGLSGVEPGKTLFIDDLEQNIRAAQEVGLKTFWLNEGLEMAELF